MTPLNMKNFMQSVVITVFKMKADTVRQVALKYNYLYEEKPVLENEHLIKFLFKELDNVNTKILAEALSPDVFAYKAIIDKHF